MVWPARGPVRAVCAARGERGWHPHRSPGEGCRCGIYAAKRLEQLPREAYVVTAATAVVGSVAVWGKVIDHERGYRVEFAYPDRIRLVCAGCLCLFTERVPGGVVRFADGLLAPICAEHLPVMWLDPNGPPLAGAPLDAGLIQEELLATYAVDLLSLATLNRARLRAKAKHEASSS
jgi:hypothetical protein